MATGSWNDHTGEYEFTLAETWNGSGWSLLPTPSPGSFADELRGVSCTNSAACIAVGDFEGTGFGRPLAEAWNGTSWSRVRIPSP
jgi:hypothetical protein